MTRLGFVCSLFLAVAAAQPQRSDFAQSRREATFPPDIFDTRPVAFDPSHFRMVLENDHVKVIRVLLGPREKSIVMEIPAHVMTCVTDQRIRVNYAHTKPAERLTESRLHRVGGARRIRSRKPGRQAGGMDTGSSEQWREVGMTVIRR
jgi:hypothetical protein